MEYYTLKDCSPFPWKIDGLYVHDKSGVLIHTQNDELDGIKNAANAELIAETSNLAELGVSPLELLNKYKEAIAAIQLVWDSDKLNKMTALENIGIDGTVHKFDNELTQKVHEVLSKRL